ncbi:19553_t:CDS:2, partial [Gigaspora rosea]
NNRKLPRNRPGVLLNFIAGINIRRLDSQAFIFQKVCDVVLDMESHCNFVLRGQTTWKSQ